MAAAPYVCFLDADDWWETTFLEEMAALIARHPDAGIYGTGYTIISEHNHKTRIAPIGVEDSFVEGEINYCQVYARTLCMPLWTGAVCIPRTIFNEAGGFPEDIKLGEDFLLWIHIALAHKVVLLNRPLANYNQDVDTTFRGTHHLHKPEHNMLWHLGDLEPLEQTNADYKQLVDRLRIYGLMPYLADVRYVDMARSEADKVDWSVQPAHVRTLCHLPSTLLRLRSHMLKLGVIIKQKIIFACHH